MEKTLDLKMFGIYEMSKNELTEINGRSTKPTHDLKHNYDASINQGAWLGNFLYALLFS